MMSSHQFILSGQLSSSHAIDHASNLSDLEIKRLATALPADASGILPVGRCGDLLWNGIPRSFARLVAAPTAMAHVLVPRTATLDVDRLWDELVAVDIAKLEVLPTDNLSESRLEFPVLAPQQARRIPAAVRHEFQKLATGSSAETIAVRAGMLQLWDDLPASHECSQSIEGSGLGAAGYYWHAIMHRREPDYGNSKYWFRRVGTHDIFPRLAEQAAGVLADTNDPQAKHWAQRLTQPRWDALAFVDLCQQQARNEASSLGIAARQIQLLEMLLLLQFTLHTAVLT